MAMDNLLWSRSPVKYGDGDNPKQCLYPNEMYVMMILKDYYSIF